jgi:AcrR family transcriptional regulator
MADNDLAPVSASAGTAAVSWRDLAVARLVGPVRVRAEERVQRIVDAAIELTGDGRRDEFTLQDVVDRSGLSLRTIYQYFAGKHGILVAIFEESLRSTVEHLRDRVEEVQDPVGRLRLFVLEYHRLCQPTGAGRSSDGRAPVVMTEFAQQLLTSHPKEALRAFASLAALVEQLLDEARVAGMIRADLGSRSIAGIILQAVMHSALTAAISDASSLPKRDAAEALWQLVLYGIAAGP